MKGRDESLTQAKVSFGGVTTYVFDTASSDLASPQRSSVEDFERLCCQPRPHRKGATHRGFDANNSQARLDPRNRSRLLKELRRQIEETIDTAGVMIGAESSVCPPQPQSRVRHDVGQLFNASFPGPDKPLLRRPRARSMTRISELHLSQLNLRATNSRKSTGVSMAISEVNSERVCRMHFSRSNTTPGIDTAPTRPTRKRSTDKIAETCSAKGLGAPTRINLQNATWKMMSQTSNKRGRDCRDVKSFACKDPSAAPDVSLPNATWGMPTRPNKRHSKDRMLGSSFPNRALLSSLDCRMQNATWQPPARPARKESKENFLKRA